MLRTGYVRISLKFTGLALAFANRKSGDRILKVAQENCYWRKQAKSRTLRNSQSLDFPSGKFSKQLPTGFMSAIRSMLSYK